LRLGQETAYGFRILEAPLAFRTGRRRWDNMILAFILGLWALLGPSSPTHSYFPQTPTSQQTPDPNSGQTAPKQQEPSPKDRQPQEKPEQQPPPPEGKPPEPGETQPQAQPPQEQPQQPTPPPAPANPAPAQPPQAVPEKPAPEVEPSRKPPARKGRGTKAATTKKDPPPANSEPKKVVVRNGGAPEPSGQLAPGMSRDEASRSRQSINQLLASTEENLKRTRGRSLTANERAMVEQIRAFITQAHAALKVGDLQRGHNLAMKAHLLSDDLVQH